MRSSCLSVKAPKALLVRLFFGAPIPTSAPSPLRLRCTSFIPHFCVRTGAFLDCNVWCLCLLKQACQYLCVCLECGGTALVILPVDLDSWALRQNPVSDLRLGPSIDRGGPDKALDACVRLQGPGCSTTHAHVTRFVCEMLVFFLQVTLTRMRATTNQAKGTGALSPARQHN